MNGIPMAFHGLILSQDGATPSRMFVGWLLFLFGATLYVLLPYQHYNYYDALRCVVNKGVNGIMYYIITRLYFVFTNYHSQ